MAGPQQTPRNNFSERPTYQVRVRGTKYLWGSAGLVQDIDFDRPVILHLYNEPFGEAITLSTRTAAGVATTIGVIEPGECVSLSLGGVTGVLATCDQESVVACLLQ